MADVSITFEYDLKRADEFVKKGGFSIDAEDYLCTHLECDFDELDGVISNSEDAAILDIAQWAASMCNFMHNIVIESVLNLEAEVAQEYARNMAEEGTDEYEEIVQEITDEFSYDVTSVELSVNGKIYKGL